MDWPKLLGTSILAGGVAYVLYQQYQRGAAPPPSEKKDDEWVVVETPTEPAAAAQRPQPKSSPPPLPSPAVADAEEEKEEEPPATPTLLTPADFRSAASSSSSSTSSAAVAESPQEWSQRVFKAADFNGDGELSKSEIKKYFKRNTADKAALLGADFTWGAFWGAVDEDGDGKITIDEFTHMAIRVAEATDTNGGGGSSASAVSASSEGGSSSNSSGGSGSGGAAVKACCDYKLDMTASQFGVCACGFPKSVHIAAQADSQAPEQAPEEQEQGQTQEQEQDQGQEQEQQAAAAAAGPAKDMTVEEVTQPADANAVAAAPTLVAGERVPEENIWISASEGNIADVKQWVTVHGMPIDAKDEWGYTPLAAASSYNYGELVSWLLAEGADPNVRDEDGESPLFGCEKPAMVDLLVAGGADMLAENKQGLTALNVFVNETNEGDATKKKMVQHMINRLTEQFGTGIFKVE